MNQCIQLSLCYIQKQDAENTNVMAMPTTGVLGNTVLVPDATSTDNNRDYEMDVYNLSEILFH